jgi:hypothetical protein
MAYIEKGPKVLYIREVVLSTIENIKDISIKNTNKSSYVFGMKWMLNSTGYHF